MRYQPTELDRRVRHQVQTNLLLSRNLYDVTGTFVWGMSPEGWDFWSNLMHNTSVGDAESEGYFHI